MVQPSKLPPDDAETNRKEVIDANHYLTEKTQLPQFFQFPFFLLDQPISTTAKIVYMILYDRSRLSMQNGWQSDGKIYTIYPITCI